MTTEERWEAERLAGTHDVAELLIERGAFLRGPPRPMDPKLLRWMHENVVAEMVNGLKWLSDTEWWEMRDGQVRRARGSNAPP